MEKLKTFRAEYSFSSGDFLKWKSKGIYHPDEMINDFLTEKPGRMPLGAPAIKEFMYEQGIIYHIFLWYEESIE